MGLIRYFCILIIFLFITSCAQDRYNGSLDIDLYNSIIFNDNLKFLFEGHLYKNDSIYSVLESKNKIISIVDGVCMKCVINDMNMVDEIFQELINNGRRETVMIFILNIPRSDSVYFIRNFEPFINVRGVTLWDNAYSFEKTNNILTSDKNLRTFFIDEENKIKLIGNPLFNHDLIEEYKKVLE